MLVRKLALLIIVAPLAEWSQPCTAAAANCTEWFSFGSGPERSLVYSTYPLGQVNASLTRALVIVHGAGRDADHYFRTAVAAAFLAGELEDTEIVSLRFASNQNNCRDALASNEVNWDCVSWRAGGATAANSRITSFDLTDGVLGKLARHAVFPNMRSIVVAGFSAGGQYVNRYAMTNQVHDKLGVPVSYVVGSPSSYAYPGPLRPSPDGSTFQPFADAPNCTTYDR